MYSAMDLVNVVRELALASPDNVYQQCKDTSSDDYMRCFYAKGACSNGSVGCIIGQALAKSGVDVAQFDGKHVAAAPTVIGFAFPDFKRWDFAMRWCSQVQGNQDGGTTWGNAVRLADEWAAHHLMFSVVK